MPLNPLPFRLLPLVTLSFSVLLFGCTLKPKLSLETSPLFPQIQARVGVSIPATVRAYSYQDPLNKIDFGEVSASRFIQVFQSMFSETVPLADWSPSREDIADFDAIIELSNVQFHLRMGGDEGNVAYYMKSINLDGGRDISGNPDIAFISYKVCLYRPDGTTINCWEVYGNQHHQRSLFDCQNMAKCNTALTELAIRDALSKFMLDFEHDPLVQKWVLDLTEEHSGQSGIEQETSPLRPHPSQESAIGLLNWPIDQADSLNGMDDCLARGISAECEGSDIVRQEIIREQLFPLMEPSTQPKSGEDFSRLLQREDVQDRLHDKGINFLATFSFGTQMSNRKGWLYGGCGGLGQCAWLGFAWIDRNTNIDVQIWEIGKEADVSTLETNIDGTVWLPAYFVPTPIPAFTETKACQHMSHQIVEHIRLQSQGRMCQGE